MKKVRGFKRKLRWLQQVCAEIDLLSIDMLQTYHYDYSNLGLGPWHWHDWQGQRPPRIVRQLAANKLITTCLQWHSQLTQQPEPFYLGVHLTQANFAHDSQVIAAIQDRIDRYQEQPDPDGPLLPEEYQVLPEANQLSWATYPQVTLLDADDYPEGWPAWALRRRHDDYQTPSGEQYLVVQIGWTWVGTVPNA